MLTIPKIIRSPVVMRSRLMLEVTSELVAANEWPDKQVMISLRPQGHDSWRIKFFGSDAPNEPLRSVTSRAVIHFAHPVNRTVAMRCHAVRSFSHDFVPVAWSVSPPKHRRSRMADRKRPLRRLGRFLPLAPSRAAEAEIRG